MNYCCRLHFHSSTMNFNTVQKIRPGILIEIKSNTFCIWILQVSSSAPMGYPHHDATN
uniref:Uncharacterized protein n=1 Tax=Anguilla anguilla TaxID=7936 RepID=A0A0E9SIV1_ANGAN